MLPSGLGPMSGTKRRRRRKEATSRAFAVT
jgi:hypothetical protein